MKIILLIDFGSTYTKITAVDLEKEVIVGTASSFTTINTDINEGLHRAIETLEKQTGKLKYDEYLACSSAAGGLKMIASGLVPGVTTTAAKEACLGAGAKVIKVYSFEMTEEDIEEIEKIKPEIFLLAGGTNGGDKKCILHNAKMLSTCKVEFPIIIGGNNEVSNKCKKILKDEKRAAFSVIGDEGYPYTIPINFYYEEADHTIYFHGAREGHKMDAIQKCNKVCLTTWNQGFKKEGHWEWNATSVVVFGKAELITDTKIIEDRLRKLAEKYYPTVEEVEKEMNGSARSRVQLFAIRIEHMTGKLVNEK